MISNSEGKTKRIAAKFVEKYKSQLRQKCLIFALEGDLGVGKTIFAKGVAEALGIKKVIRSPSFIIQREFPYKVDGFGGNFIHIDLWRMESGLEVKKLKIEELIKPSNVILIEWAEKIGDLWPKLLGERKTLVLYIKINHIDKQKRELNIKVLRY
jgi:tRNA threonylcarbamoyl adenosine modification protein YjeE